MNKKSLFKDKIKIKAAKNLMVPFLIVTVVSSTLAGVAGFIDYRQEKQLESLERLLNPSEAQAKEYREEIKKYFASYMHSEEAKKSIMTEMNMEEAVYDELAKNGFENMLTDEDIEEMMDLAIQEISRNSALNSSISAQESALYSTLYNKLLYRVRDNLVDNGAFTVTTTVTYDADKILAEVRQEIASVQAKLNSDIKKAEQNKANSQISVTDVRDAYVNAIVENQLNKLVLTDSEKTSIKDNVLTRLTDYLNSEEGKKLCESGKDGKDGVDGKPIDWTDEQIIDLIAEASQSLIDAILEDQAKGPDSVIEINAIDGQSIDVDETTVATKTKSNTTGKTASIQLSWTRGDWNANKQSSKIEVLIPSFDGFTYTEDGASAASLLAILLDDENAVSATNLAKNGKITVTQGDVTKSISVDSLADAFAQNYMAAIYGQMKKQPIGSVATKTDASGNPVYYCTKDNGAGAECGHVLTHDAATGLYSCDVHDAVATTITDVLSQSNNVLDNMQNIASMANKYYDASTNTGTTDTQNADMQESADIVNRYMLNMYNEILNQMNAGDTGKTFFDYYSKELKDYDNNIQLGYTNFYGMSDVMPNTVLNDTTYANYPVILRYLILEYNVQVSANGTLSFDTLEHAYQSPLIQIMETYMTYANDSDKGLQQQITEWTGKLNNIVEIMKLMRGDGIIITVTGGNLAIANTNTALDTFVKDMVDKITPSQTFDTFVLPLHFAYVDTFDGSDIKAAIVNSHEKDVIDRVYYQNQTIHIIPKTNITIPDGFSFKVTL